MSRPPRGGRTCFRSHSPPASGGRMGSALNAPPPHPRAPWRVPTGRKIAKLSLHVCTLSLSQLPESSPCLLALGSPAHSPPGYVPAARQGCERRRARSLAVPPAGLSAARSCDAARARGRLCRGMRRRRRRRLSARLKQWQQFVGRRERLGPAPGGELSSAPQDAPGKQSPPPPSPRGQMQQWLFLPGGPRPKGKALLFSARSQRT